MSANQEQIQKVNTQFLELENIKKESEKKNELSLRTLRKSLEQPIDVSVEKEKSDEEVVRGMLSKMFEMNLEEETIRQGILQGLTNKNQQVINKASSFNSEKLKARMGDLKGTEEGNALFDQMTNLNKTLREIHPSNFDMAESFFQKWVPWVASPIRKYFDQYRTTESVIEESRKKIEQAIKEQKLDIEILRQDKQKLAEISVEIKKAISFNTVLKEEIEMQLHNNMDLSPEVRDFLETQVLFNVTREVQGLQEILTVNMQGQQAFEMLMRTGKDLVDAADRCIHVSINALRIAAVIAHVVTGQQKLLKTIQESNKIAEESINWNAKQLNTVVKEVGRAAVQTNLDVSVLENAINMSIQAIEDDIKFRRESLPMMNENVTRLSAATDKAEESTKKLEQARNFKENYDNQAAELFNI